MTQFTRRRLVKGGVGLAGGAYLTRSSAGLSDSVKKPHFFLQVYYSGGFDSSYLFDGRPLSHTKAGKIQNYLGTDPTPWTGRNGQACLASSLVSPLISFKDHFSIINGVINPALDDGHDQNRNILFTGNTFGGDTYLPNLSEKVVPHPSLDFFVSGNLDVPVANGASSIYLHSNGINSFVNLINSMRGIDRQDPSTDFSANRLKHLANGKGRFSEGVRHMLSGMNESFSLASKFKGMDLTTKPEDSRMIKELKMAHQLFVSGVSNTVVISDISNGNEDIDLDTHDGPSAAKQPKTYASIVSELAEMFQYLKNVAFDEAQGLSLLDVTTVLISSEFNRTNYQVGKSMDTTGTDHNSLSNMILIGGKGIKGGLVMGATDLDVLDKSEKYSHLTPAHLKLDPALVMRMGKPFNFESEAPLNVSPETFNSDQYLTIGSVINTILALYGCPESKFWSNVANGPKAKILSGLLA
jgi:hypothetical protein